LVFLWAETLSMALRRAGCTTFLGHQPTPDAFQNRILHIHRDFTHFDIEDGRRIYLGNIGIIIHMV
jgi:hypothetical protein